MPDERAAGPVLPAVASVSDVARLVGLSRARFYQLIGTTFPPPTRADGDRPYYTEDQIRICVEVKRRNLGVDGKPILFYCARTATPPNARRRRPVPRTVAVERRSSRWGNVIEGLKSLGLEGATDAQVEAAIREAYPAGTDGIPDGDLLRTCFRRLRQRQNPSDNVR